MPESKYLAYIDGWSPRALRGGRALPNNKTAEQGIGMEWLTIREPVNAWTHGVWFLLCIPATAVLLRAARGDRLKQLGFAVFGVCSLFCFGSSALFHTAALPRRGIGFFELLDFIGIYLLIAGSMTPLALVALTGWWRRLTLAGAWAFAAVGIILRLSWDTMPREVYTGLYLGMGWGILLSYFALARALTHRAMGLGVLGGVLYSIGAMCNLMRWPMIYPGVFGAHEVMHLFVMGGSLAHFFFMLRVVAPFDRRRLSLVAAQRSRPQRAVRKPAAAESRAAVAADEAFS